ncbi:hypothetical protein RSAG8_08834, partial [Rhizoctonia solani AG-8 WAC10335]
MSAAPRELTPEELEKLIQAAIAAKETAYSPYSKFRVGAALFSTDGKIIAGGNVENASYGGAICAERTALVKAVSEGIKTFLAIAVTSDVDDIISPCGICRLELVLLTKPCGPVVEMTSRLLTAHKSTACFSIFASFKC